MSFRTALSGLLLAIITAIELAPIRSWSTMIDLLGGGRLLGFWMTSAPLACICAMTPSRSSRRVVWNWSVPTRYDGKSKERVRFDDGGGALVGGSKVER